jgi:L-threonylcarbamoyladenylate synthase
MWNNKNLVKTLKEDGIVVMPTDTIYGVVGSALSTPVVNRIYALRKRDPDKPCIILIGSVNELEKFSIHLSGKQSTKIKEYWPGSVSIILDCLDETFAYVHRGTKTLAFRLPAQEELCALLIKTGPLIAPSANPEGMSPAQSTEEAKKYFGDSVDLYIDGGQLTGKPSKVIKLHKDGSINILRE